MEIAALGLRIDGADGVESATVALGGLVRASEAMERAAALMSEKFKKTVKDVEDGRAAYERLRTSVDANFAAAAKLKTGTSALDDLLKKGTITAKEHADTVRLMGEQYNKSTSKVSELAQAARRAGQWIGAALGVRAIKNYADTWSDMQSQVGAATGDMARAAVSMQRLTDIANASYSPLQQTVDTFARNVGVLRDLGRSSAEAADFTESLNHMLVLTATRGERAASVQNALAKAMAVGKLQADGLETVLANGGEVAQALARELGTTVSGLRGLAGQGKITGQVIANAIIKPLEDVRERAAEMPATLSDAFVRVQNNMTEFVGRIDKASGASSALADRVLQFADGIRTAGNYVLAFGAWAAPAFDMARAALASVAQYADIALVALAGFYTPAMLGGIALLSASLAVGLVNAIKAVTVALLANPIGAFAAALAAAGYAAFKFRDDIKQAIGVDVVSAATTAANRFIGTFVAAFEVIKAYWSNFPTLIGAVMVGAVNLYIGYINSLVEAARGAVNTVIGLANKIPGVNIGELEAGDAIKVIDNPYAAAAQKAAKDAVAAAKAAFGKDWIAALVAGFKLPDQSDFAGGSPGASVASGAAGKDSELAKLIKQLQLQYDTLGMTTEQAARYEIEIAKGTKAERERALSLYDQVQAWKASAKAREQATESGRQYLAFQKELQAFQDQINFQTAAVGMSDRQRDLAQQELSIRQEYARKRLELEQAQQVAATALEYAQYQKRLEHLNEFEQAKLGAIRSGAEARAIAETDWTNGAMRALQNFSDQAANVAAQAEGFLTNLLGTMTSGFANAFEAMVFDAKSLGDAVGDMAEAMARAVVNAVGQMIAQWIAYQAIQLVTGKATQAAGATALAANASATSLQAGLAAFASTAAIPIVGPILAPAAMGAALAITAPLAAAVGTVAMAGMAHDGIDSIPQTGTWLLEKGERVTTAKTSARLDSVLERIDARQRQAAAGGADGARQGSDPRVTVQLIGAEFQGAQVTEERSEVTDETIIRVVSRDLMSGGPLSKIGTRHLGWRRSGS